ncbi:MAG: hypothetical protein KC433_04010 [Anaerolineales bacterium]|nr:hypothetical protein [Anaerolineales bacterium]MCB8940177.1 hypothetical protein [Ardenticatenaceae bacterium]
MPKLNRIAATRIVATPTALDSADVPQSSLALRFAADELFITPPLQDESIITAHDPHAILIREGGFAGTWLPATEAAEFLARNCEWEMPNGRPAFAQGAVAGIPTKLWLEDEQVLFIVPAPYAHDFAERLEKE